MKNITIKLLLNRTVYNMTDDLSYIKDFLSVRGINVTWRVITTDISGYTVTEITNVFGNQQYVLSGAEPLVKPYLAPDDDICALIIQGFKEFNIKCPSESEDKQFIEGTKTVFLSANADDSFYDQVPNFRIWLMHEILHALGTIAINKGFPIVDCMDVLYINGRPLYYYYNQTPEYPNSNFINQIERLEKWIQS